VSQDVASLVDHLFRHSAGRVVASLVRKLGPQHLELAEDAFQEGLIKALRSWPYRGAPEYPEAWLRRVAFNHALDALRRDGRKRMWDESFESIEADPDDDVLAMMLICCHPAVAPAGQVALILNLVAGFSVPEISRAFLTSDATIYQRLRRGRLAVAAADGAQVQDAWRSDERIDALLAALYLLFNEGYALSSGERHISRDVCEEAIRLTSLIAEWDAIDRPDIDALLALMLLQAARIPSRVGPDEDIVTLALQDREKWDRALIDAGLEALARSARGETLTSYHLQAGIAALHCIAPSYGETDWTSILDHYDALVEIEGTSVVALNRAVAFSMVHGPSAGLDLLDELLARHALEDYALFHATIGELAAQSGDRPRAIQSYARARSLVQSTPERKLLDLRLARYMSDEIDLQIHPEIT